jgi:DNA-binding NtrC family response regulator
VIDTNALKGIIVANGYSQRKVAKQLGMTEKTFYSKMNKGVFDSDEIENMIDILNIKNPVEIFFAKNVT